jgi:hypothetical protein
LNMGLNLISLFGHDFGDLRIVSLLVTLGTTMIPNLDENIGAAFVKLTPEEVKEVAAAVPEHEVGGRRFGDDLFRVSWTQVTTPPLSSYAASQ